VHGSWKLAAPLAAALAVAARNAGGSSNIPALTPPFVPSGKGSKVVVALIDACDNPNAAEDLAKYRGYSAPTGWGTPNGINAF
jgi:hypothetical protein